MIHPSNICTAKALKKPFPQACVAKSPAQTSSDGAMSQMGLVLSEVEGTQWTTNELNGISTAQLELLQSFAANQTAQQVFRAWSRIALVLSAILTTIPQVQSKLRGAKKQIVEAIDAAGNTIPKKFILRFLDISRGTYQSWKSQVLHPCYASGFSFCLKVWPQQATRHEIATIKDMLHDPQFTAWPVRSVA